MITCQECIENLKPDDPRVRVGKYDLCGCDYCNKPSYYRGLEVKESQERFFHIERRTYVQKVDGKDLFHLRNNLIAYIDKKLNALESKKVGKKGKYVRYS